MTVYHYADNYNAGLANGAHASAIAGSNANPGSFALPKRTITQGIIDSLQPGDEIRFALGGAWSITSGSWFQLDQLGTEAAPIKFTTYDAGGQGGARPIINSTSTTSWFVMVGGFGHAVGPPWWSGLTIEGLDFFGNSLTETAIYFGSPLEWVTVQDCTFRNFQGAAVYFQGAGASYHRFIIFRRNTVEACGFAGWLGCATDCLIEKNTFNNCGNVVSVETPAADYGKHHSIYYGAGGVPTYRTTIRLNELTDSAHDGTTLQGGSLTWRGQLFYTTVEANVVLGTLPAYNRFAYGLSHFSSYDTAEYHYDTVVRGNRVVNLANGCVIGQTVRPIVENNAFINTRIGQNPAPWFGIQFAAGGNTPGNVADLQSSDVTVRSNSIYHANPPPNSVGIQATTSSGDSGVTNYPPGPNVKIDNNFIVFGTPISGSTYAFNPLSETAPTTYASIRNNMWSGVTQPSSAYASVAAFEAHYAGIGASCSGNASTTTPGITTPTSGNGWSLQLTAGSEAIGAARALSAPALAIDAYARDAAPDIGAFEAPATNPTFTSLGSGGLGVDGASSVATTPVTLTANRLCLLTIISAFNNGNTPTCPGWTLVTTAQYGTIARMTVLRRMVTSDLTGTHTYDFAGQGQYFTKWAISQSSASVDTSGTNGSGAIVQSATNGAVQPAPTTNGLSVSATLSAFASPYNSTFAVFGGSYASATPTAGSGFTQLTTAGVGSFAYALITEFKASNDTVADATWSGVADVWVGAALEIKAANT